MPTPARLSKQSDMDATQYEVSNSSEASLPLEASSLALSRQPHNLRAAALMAAAKPALAASLAAPLFTGHHS